MNFKKSVLILGIIVLLASMIAVSAEASQQNVHNIQEILDTTNESDMTGCCSVVLQLDGNNSIMSFRRDADNAAEIFIEKVDWHGKQAVKQYKTSAGYFCQVVVTNDGWVLSYGGIDDGEDNEKIENITGNMVNASNGTISEDVLQQVQDIKASYGLGHLVIKAPDGTYGLATATTHFTGKLKPNDYISIPNRYTYFRSGDVLPNATDKIKTMNNLAISDGFGLTRRDVTTFVFETGNTSNVTNVYISNDDGSYWGMSTGGLCDDVNFLGNVTKASDIPIAPTYKHLGNVTFDQGEVEGGNNAFNFFTVIFYLLIIVIVGVVAFIAYHIVRVVRYNRRRYRR